MKDVAYFLGSCLSDESCASRHGVLLDIYFARLRASLISGAFADALDELESEWRRLFPVAWADFHRFLLGWCPTHSKLTRFSSSMVDQTLESLASPP